MSKGEDLSVTNILLHLVPILGPTVLMVIRIVTVSVRGGMSMAEFAMSFVWPLSAYAIWCITTVFHRKGCIRFSGAAQNDSGRHQTECLGAVVMFMACMVLCGMTVSPAASHVVFGVSVFMLVSATVYMINGWKELHTARMS